MPGYNGMGPEGSGPGTGGGFGPCGGTGDMTGNRAWPARGAGAESGWVGGPRGGGRGYYAGRGRFVGPGRGPGGFRRRFFLRSAPLYQESAEMLQARKEQLLAEVNAIDAEMADLNKKTDEQTTD